MRWFAALGVLLFALAGCSSGGSPSSGAGDTSSSVTNTVAFTASGGLNGSYIISSQVVDGNENHDASGGTLTMGVANSAWQFEIHVSSYSGPGSYMLNAQSGAIRLTSADHTRLWDFSAGAGNIGACVVHVAIDTRVDVQGSALDQVKGEFSCSRLTSDGSSSEEPITLSSGQFTVFVDATSAG